MNVIDPIVEKTWLEQYLVTLPTQRVIMEKNRIHYTCQQLRLIYPVESGAELLKSTEWIPSWVEHVSETLRPTEQVSHVQALGRWWTWLFERDLIDDNVFACFDPYSATLSSPPVNLKQNLQRRIAQYIDERGTRQVDTRRKVRRNLLNFNLFIHRFYTTDEEQRINEKVISAWLQHIARTCGFQGVVLVASMVSRFLDYLVDTAYLISNPFATLQAMYDVQNRTELLAGLLKPTEHEELKPAVPTPCFKSFLGPRLETFISLKRAMGRRYKTPVKDLRRFDRFVANIEPTPDFISRELIDAWITYNEHLNPRALKKLLGLTRQFCVYLLRIDPRTYIPGRDLVPTRIPSFKPYIYSTTEVRALLDAALSMPVGRYSLRPKIFYTVILLLYATGLRIGEALRLRLRDVDLTEKTLFIRDTKFFKSRIIPVSKSLCDAIRTYLGERLSAAPSPLSFLFLNYYARPYSPDKFAEEFRGLLRFANVPQSPTTQRPRVYDMRHTFAVTNLMRWYQDGDDIMARLPLLSTYMGHVSVISTQEYLRATPELLRAASKRFENAYGSVITGIKEVSDVIH